MKAKNNFEIVMEYVDSIIGCLKVACKEIIQACHRFKEYLANPEYEFRTKDAEFVINIIENTFVHAQGER